MKKWASKVVVFTFIAALASANEVPDQILRGLSADDFQEREASQTKLLTWAEKREGDEVSSVHSLWKDSDDPEVSNRCLKVLRELSDQDYLLDGQGYLGIEMREEMVDLPGAKEPQACIRITRVVVDSPAKLVGLRPGDLITALNSKSWDKAGAIDDFMVKIADTKPQNKVVLTIARKDQDTFDLEIRLGKRPVENLHGIGQDLMLLDQQARKTHFESWLKKLEANE